MATEEPTSRGQRCRAGSSHRLRCHLHRAWYSCHHSMTTYLDVLADEIRREVPADALPNEDTTDLFRLYAVLLLAKGQSVSRQDVHNAWVAWMSARGKQHSSMRPFEELPD